MLRSTDSTRLPMLSELPLRRNRLGCLVTCLLLANHGAMATAEDATSVNRAEASWSQEVWNEACDNADRCLGLLQALTDLLRPIHRCGRLAAVQPKSIAEAEVLADRTWAWDRVRQDVAEEQPVLALQDLIRVQTLGWIR